MTKSRRTTSPFERFWKFVSVPKNEDDCWEWLGRKSYKNYGIMKINSRSVQAHRFSYEIHYKEQIPFGLLACHRCDNPSCVNPKHIFIGTVQENNLDRDRKGRKALGERNGRSKLTLSEVKKIKRLFENGHSTTEVVEIMNRLHSTITNIKLGRSWKWV